MNIQKGQFSCNQCGHSMQSMDFTSVAVAIWDTISGAPYESKDTIAVETLSLLNAAASSVLSGINRRRKSSDQELMKYWPARTRSELLFQARSLEHGANNIRALNEYIEKLTEVRNILRIA